MEEKDVSPSAAVNDRPMSRKRSPAPRRPRRRTHERVLAKVPDHLPEQVDRWVEEWIKRKFPRGLELRAADPGPFNYPIEVFSEWGGKAFYICATYRTPSGNPE